MLARTRDPLFTDAMRCEFASWKLDAGNFTKVCALKPDLFLLVPPHCGNPPCILLRDPPTGAVANERLQGPAMVFAYR